MKVEEVMSPQQHTFPTSRSGMVSLSVEAAAAHSGLRDCGIVCVCVCVDAYSGVHATSHTLQ